METKRVINPVDIQDREGFLQFLTDQAREGWEAVNVTLNCTHFRRADRPPRGYTMWLDPNDGDLRDPSHRAMWESREDVERENAAVLAGQARVEPDWKKVGAPRGVMVYALPTALRLEETDWEGKLLDNYALTNPGGFDVLRGIKGLIVPAAALVMLVMEAMRLGAQVTGIFWPILAFVGIALCAAEILVAELLSEGIRAKHKSGLIQARVEGRCYETPEEVARWVPLKNRLEFLARPLKLVEIVLLLLVLLIWM